MAVTDPVPARPRLPWWTMPAVALDRLRPGLRERAVEDAAWLARFPTVLRSVLLPFLVMAIPLAWSAVRAVDTTTANQVIFTLRIQDIYTESIPYMVIAAAIGMAVPSLGVLFMAAHIVGDLGAAYIQPKELQPIATAVLGRAVSFWVLYLLVVELPLAAHEIATSVRSRLSGLAGRLATVGAGVATGTVLAFVWAIGATLFIRPVFTWSDLKFTTGNAGAPLLYAPDVFALAIGAFALAAFTLRYFLLPARADGTGATVPARSSVGSLVFGLIVPMVMFASVITQPIDAVILVSAVLAARPVSSLVLRRLGLARPLAIVPRPLRLLGGIALSAVVGFVIVTLLGAPQISYFFTMVIVMAVSFILTRIMLDAEEFVNVAQPGPSLATGVVAALVSGVPIWLFTAGFVLADNMVGQTDGWGTAAAAGGAAAAAGGLAAASAKKKDKKPPNPSPWYVPDSMNDYFGYDPAPDKNADKKNDKKADPKKTPDNWPKQRQRGDWDK